MAVTDLEIGDRFELAPSRLPDRLELPRSLGPEGFAIEVIEDDAGRVLNSAIDPAASAVIIPELAQLVSGQAAVLWLEYRAPGRFRLVAESGTSFPAGTEMATEQGVPILFEPRDWAVVRGDGDSLGGLGSFDLALRAARLATHAGFDRLIALPLVRDIELLEHQIRTAKTVLRRFRGRAMLCDEVGLGKTIEAGLVLSELVIRGLARSILVLVPPSLIEQWQGEMRRKFSLELISHDDPDFRNRGSNAWGEFDRVIASIHTAKREPHRSAILARRWDMVIVDEAHHLRNRNTQTWKFASEIQKQFILLLTATPVQNNLEELFNLVTLLEPGLLSTARQFQRHFVDKRDKLTPRNLDELHDLAGGGHDPESPEHGGPAVHAAVGQDRVSVAISSGALFVPGCDRVCSHSSPGGEIQGERRLEPHGAFEPSDGDGQLEPGSGRNPRQDRRATEALRGRSRRGSSTLPPAPPARARIPRSITFWPCSVSFATRSSSSRSSALLRSFWSDGSGSLDMMLRYFTAACRGWKKRAAIERFRGPARLLLCTEAGSEGRNLQFAHAVCNFDLPWNPMKIEQRIGRLSRIGQTHDVYVFNLVAANTVEAAVLHLLEAKLNMFELVIGEVDMILGNLEDEREFQDVVADLWAESNDQDDFTQPHRGTGRPVARRQARVFRAAGS